MKITVIICAVISLITGCASVQDLPATATCWRHELDEQHFRNTLTFCVLGNEARMTTYYPNPSYVPTTCKARGTATLDSDGILKLSFDRGACKNTKETIAYTMQCKADRLYQLCSLAAEAELPGLFRFTPVQGSSN